MSKFIDCERNQAFLLPPDLRDWIPEDDLAHFVIEAVERVEMSAFKVSHRGTGSAQYHPRMMLALLIYCYANGIFSSRRIERATHRDLGVRFVAANVHPDHDTIATFRRDNLAAFGESFLQVLLLAKELKLVKVGLVSVDGSKFEASASKHRSVTYERAGELIDQLKLDIADLMERAAAADGEGERRSGSDLPPDNFSLCNQWLMLIFCPTFRIGWTSLFVLCSAIWQRRSWSSPSGWPRRCMSLPPSGSHAPNKT